MQFKDKFNDDFNLVTVSLGRRQRAEEQIDEYEIPYRNDNLIVHSGKYKPYLREFELIAKDKTMIPIINQWLSGRGKLRTEIDEGGYFVASVMTGLPYEAFLNNINTFRVGFKVNPFFYLDDGDRTKILTTPIKIYNSGTIYSEPYIKINGTGNIDLIINSTVYSFTDVIDYIQIDSELMTVYKDTLNQGEKMTGEFPILEVGLNNISWNGNVTSIEIKPRWREL